MSGRDDFASRSRPGGSLGVTRGEMRATSAKAQQDLKRMSPDNNYGLGLARVTCVDYEGFLITLRTVFGASQEYERVPVPMVFPGAGARYFLGAMPQVGDCCIIGWSSQESTSSGDGTKMPIILGWVLPGTWPGRDWVTTSDFPSDEFDPGHGERVEREGSFERVRHKLRHIQPGNIVASSAQGSDLVLDEGVTLANRRGNEFRLRDQDQAAILRALQSFQALAGTRIYAGMVQRDAAFLPTPMVSDGKEWDGNLQASAGSPISDLALPADSDAPRGLLTPAHNLSRSRDGSALTRAVLPVNPYLDPYQFLRNGGFINEFGYVTDGMHQADAVYGGKPIFRVSSQSGENTAANPGSNTLTEYRLELTHTSDGRLPVTEQTDMFDAERLPDSDPRSGTATPPSRVPFLEWVLGSVVGNDPFSQDGRAKYGVPIVAQVFNGDTPSPRLEAAKLAVAGSGASPTPILDQAATLFRLTPPTGGIPSTFVSYNKQGQLRASIGGDPKGNAAEVFLNGGLKLGVSGRFQLLLDGHTELGTTGKSSMSVTASEGAVRIYGGGPLKTVESDQAAILGTDSGAGDVPAVDIEARTNVRIKAEKKVLVKGNQAEVNATQVNIVGHESVTLDGVKKTSISTENFQISVGGKCQESYSGPKYFLPTNFPLHERTYAPLLPGFVSEKVTYVAGDREETFYLGNHKTSILIGNMTYQTLAGFWTARAMTSQMTMGLPGIQGVAAAGVVTMTALAGAAVISGVAAASLIATAGIAMVRGTAGVYLGGPITGPNFGGLVCSGSLEPFTGLPFGTWGIGSPNHIVGP